MSAQPPAPARPATRGWWRRNVWGLLAVVPLLAGTLAMNTSVYVLRNITNQPSNPVVVAPGDVVSYAGAALQLVSLTEVPPDPDQVGEGRTLPDGITIWRSVVRVDQEPDSTITTCDIYLEDTQGRVFADKPSELKGFELGAFGCLHKDFVPDPDNLLPEDDEKEPYESTAYFVLPSDTRPMGLRVTQLLELPRYVVLTV